jgi:hypothetical protein
LKNKDNFDYVITNFIWIQVIKHTYCHLQVLVKWLAHLDKSKVLEKHKILLGALEQRLEQRHDTLASGRALPRYTAGTNGTTLKEAILAIEGLKEMAVTEPGFLKHGEEISLLDLKNHLQASGRPTV